MLFSNLFTTIKEKLAPTPQVIRTITGLAVDTESIGKAAALILHKDLQAVSTEPLTVVQGYRVSNNFQRKFCNFTAHEDWRSEGRVEKTLNDFAGQLWLLYQETGKQLEFALPTVEDTGFAGHVIRYGRIIVQCQLSRSSIGKPLVELSCLVSNIGRGGRHIVGQPSRINYEELSRPSE